MTITTDGRERAFKTWSEEEDNYLCENWGLYSVPTIAKHLKRTNRAIESRVLYLGLGSHLESSGYISLRSVIKEFGLDVSHDWQIRKLVETGLPTHKQRVNKKSFLMVDIDEFWEFMETHQNLLSFARLELNALGKEPSWVKEKRRKDYLKSGS